MIFGAKIIRIQVFLVNANSFDQVQGKSSGISYPGGDKGEGHPVGYLTREGKRYIWICGEGGIQWDILPGRKREDVYMDISRNK